MQRIIGRLLISLAVLATALIPNQDRRAHLSRGREGVAPDTEEEPQLRQSSL